ncbi:CBF/Mak21 family-domain-containing protein [Pelagophyceae sp. CCMP2097]|nr:CBF/Mak21 family-domain-containing protein [Pelagophyceae sp. CCMP2097]|mmetsp:Transcript_19754/g.67843  ORF Transcript_19754/g.67843 Transcript_19754/m.67843 type:complete len:764 (-) Transcript_19754:35-2326(-)
MGKDKFASAPADAGEASSSAPAPAVPKRGKAITKDAPVADGAPWYALTAAAAASKLSKADLAKAAARGEAVYVKSVEAWERAKKKGETGDDRYMAQVVKSGTLADKVAALTLQIQESPQHRLATLDALLSLAKSGRHTSKMAIESLKDLFVNTLLPDRPCRAVAAQVCDVRLDATLFAAVFEEKLAVRFADFVALVDGYLRHSDVKLRCFALDAAADLLKSKPEREQQLLSALVNKLGDPDRAVAGRTVKCLGDVLRHHRAMTPVVAREVQAFATRANLQPKALYAAISFLNQMYLSHELEAVASSLCAMYVALFSTAVKAGEVQTRMLSALLTGINRALPYCDYAKQKDQALDLDALYKISHDGAFATRVQALALIERLTTAHADMRARFYRALYSLLQSKDLRATTKPTLLMNLVYKSISNDTDTNRAAACLKRVCQASAHMAPQVAAAALYLTARVFERRPELKSILEAERPTSSAVPTSESASKWRDALKREPMYVAAQPLWELALLRHHFHPSVQKFAEGLATKQRIDYASDPLVDLALSAFLDRFAYRNPRKQPAAQAHARTAKAGAKALDADSFLAVPASLVAPEDAFYHRYFQTTQAAKQAALSKKVKYDEDDEGDGDVFDEAEENVEADDFDNGAFADDDADDDADGDDDDDEKPLYPEDSDDSEADDNVDFDGGDDDGSGDGGSDDDLDALMGGGDGEEDARVTRADQAPVKLPSGKAAKGKRPSPFQDADAFFAQLEEKATAPSKGAKKKKV